MDGDRNGLEGLVEKIIKDLNQVLTDNDLTEFDIVPLESTTNKSPVLYVQTSLGLESWCVKHVYNYCYSELVRDFLTNPKRRLSRLSNLNVDRILDLLNPTILINPDVTTLWNKRREMVQKHFLDFESELTFTRLVLTRKPKCNEAYAYRRWILKSMFMDNEFSALYPEELIAEAINRELSVCSMIADKCQNNYHCWEHRIWLIDNVTWVHRHNFDSTLLFFNEYTFIKQWTSNHVSDYSCFHYRQHCIKILYETDDRCMPVFEKMININLRENFQMVIADHMPNDPFVTPEQISKNTITDDELIALVLGYTPGNCKCYATWNGTLKKLKILLYELVLNEDLLKYYSNHETIWYHRRFLISELISVMYRYLQIENDKCANLIRKAVASIEATERKNSCVKCCKADLSDHHKKVENQAVDWFFFCPLFKALMRYEKALIKDRRKNDKFCESYEHYLGFFEGKCCRMTLCNLHTQALRSVCDIKFKTEVRTQY